MMSLMLVRLALVLVSVAVLAWTAVLVRDELVGQAAVKRLFGDPALARPAFDRTLTRFDSAEALNPDPKWSLQRAGFLVLRGPPEQALREARALVRREPDNLNAWTIVLRATYQIDRPRTRAVLAEIRRHNPLYAVKLGPPPVYVPPGARRPAPARR